MLLVCDLDRTVLPDGPQTVFDSAMNMFKDFTESRKVVLAYATGRSFNSALNAINEYSAPQPDIIVCDVGTTIYFKDNGDFKNHSQWQQMFVKDWGKIKSKQVMGILRDLENLTPQEEKDQGNYKVSYYTPLDIDQKSLKNKIDNKLSRFQISYTILITENEIDNFCYLDILPKSATKLDALNYVVTYLKLNKDNVVYCGDSGNDLIPLVSGYKAIVVNNASENFKQKVRAIGIKNNILNSIYFAEGGYKNMNGNYTEGILEGLEYFGYLA